jgi:NADH-quinone oxidoreductase subunit L
MSSGDRFQNWLSSSTEGTLGKVELHPHNLPLLQLSIGAAVIGIVAGAITYFKGLPKNEGWDESKWSGLRLGMLNQFGFDKLMVQSAVDGGRELSNNLDSGVDRGLMNGMGVGAGQATTWIGGLIRQLQNGFIRMYALVMLLGAVLLITWLVVFLGGSK